MKKQSKALAEKCHKHCGNKKDRIEQRVQNMMERLESNATDIEAKSTRQMTNDLDSTLFIIDG